MTRARASNKACGNKSQGGGVTPSSVAGQTMYLAQSVNAGAWTKTKMLSTATSKAFTGMAVADYSYKVQFYDIDTETKREIFSHETTA